MNYEELEKIAKPHIRKDGSLPSNAFLLLTQLHIPYKTKKQCQEDYKGKMNPLYNTPAFLAIDDSGNKTIYFDSDTRYYNFYILHEIAHYLLGHEESTPQNELDASLLACILAAPLQNLPPSIETADDLSLLCEIPISHAESYWSEIKGKLPHNIKSKKMRILTGLIAVVAVILALIFGTSLGDDIKLVFLTPRDMQYHNMDCDSIKDEEERELCIKLNARLKGHDPCPLCGA